MSFGEFVSLVWCWLVWCCLLNAPPLLNPRIISLLPGSHFLTILKHTHVTMLTKFLTVSLFAVAVAASAVPPAITISKPNHCKKPFCISFCPDATSVYSLPILFFSSSNPPIPLPSPPSNQSHSPFNCCVQYIRDPCSDHQKPPVNPPIKPCTGPNDFDCKCRCEKSPE
ncbi:uncharacterized protein RAG0_04789 [Rhynchosporium agropyri]|uniref:Uncharacterized protein n=1 Tax=Rhynchosporium agropyri TaxID=914238 RepID=A0A1E1KAG5_9HELO|nr:uncharacterized protein RAG0_04789 [Rhynchosporium agropyri]